MPEPYYVYILASTFQKLYTGVTNTSNTFRKPSPAKNRSKAGYESKNFNSSPQATQPGAT
jgi:hypothetical protein